MKECSNKNKLIYALVILIIISGIIIISTIGFNKNIEYKAGIKIEVYIPKGYEKQEMQKIAKDSFKDKEVVFEEVEKLGQVTSIKLENYTQEELETYKEKISEKYNIEKDNLEVYEIDVPKTKITTIITPYIFPISLVTLLSLAYIGIRNIKSSEISTVLLKVFLTLVIVAGLYFSLIAITRLQFTKYTMPLALAIYIITLLVATIKNIKK